MLMDKLKVIRDFKAGHRAMVDVIQKLSQRQLEEEKIIDNWTVKDILAHLSAWSLEVIKEIDRVLKNKPTWPKLYYSIKGEDKFNLEAVVKRKNKSLETVVQEWEQSFQIEIKKLEKLSGQEWLHQSNGDQWEDGRPVTVFSLFDYEYQDEQHETAHAKQISQHFGFK